LKEGAWDGCLQTFYVLTLLNATVKLIQPGCLTSSTPRSPSAAKRPFWLSSYTSCWCNVALTPDGFEMFFGVRVNYYSVQLYAYFVLFRLGSNRIYPRQRRSPRL